MTKQHGPDKNLQNVVKDLDQPRINAEFNNQQQRKTDDRRQRDNNRFDEEGKLNAGGLNHVET
ncbi:hypothetical protein SD70_28195 [Gordoniibacillus kamchatkensis]|uniref:Uncharacterized protein n=1 Tax=Gordoniibacillus kamchatkensis TaxID=1590651 RepID=A0ABR5AAS7_9BACL|nr:hypothetical protein [Paenibacillus sp. VKM B-2647]KIL38159.1 hypothetical protein SD70_28195 [Paenibacillus sp. VKM B-2647]